MLAVLTSTHMSPTKLPFNILDSKICFNYHSGVYNNNEIK